MNPQYPFHSIWTSFIASITKIGLKGGTIHFLLTNELYYAYRKKKKENKFVHFNCWEGNIEEKSWKPFTGLNEGEIRGKLKGGFLRDGSIWGQRNTVGRIIFVFSCVDYEISGVTQQRH